MRPLLGLMLLACVFAGAASAGPQRIFIAGDSTASLYGPERAPRTGWGQVFDGFFDDGVEIHNLAQSGQSSRSFIEDGFFTALTRDLAAGDLLLIQFGHNDQKIDDASRATEPRAAFPGWLMRYVELARERGAVPVLITPVARRRFDAGAPVDTHGPHADAVRTLAADTQVALIDLAASSMNLIGALGEDASKRLYLHDAALGIADDTHFSVHGATAIACLVARDLVALGLIARAHTRRDIACGAEPLSTPATKTHAARVDDERLLGVMQPGPHGGAGTTTAYNFFNDAPDLGLVFRKRVLHPGASIGAHRNDKDEIFYVVSGQGVALVDGKEVPLRAGSALLSRAGGIHAIHQTGGEDLVLILTYQPRR